MDTQLSKDQALDLAIKTLIASGATEENAKPFFSLLYLGPNFK